MAAVVATGPSLDDRVVQSVDPLIFPPPNADEKLKKLWNLHGPPHAPSYANPELTSLNALLRHCAITQSSNPAYLYPADDEFVIVTWQDFNRLVLRAAAHYESLFRSDIEKGNLAGKQPTVALLGNGTTFEYWLTLLAVLRLNLRVLVLSDKNAPVSHRYLLEACDVVGLIVSSSEAGVLGMEKGFTQPPVALIGIAELRDLRVLEESRITKFRTDDEWTLQTMVIHSSGSTGMPKPIIHTNRSLCMIAKNYRLMPDFYIEHWYICAPLFHVGGLSTAMGGLPNGLPATFPPRNWPPAPSAILAAWRKLEEMGMPVDCAQITPSLVVDMSDYIDATTRDYSPFIKLKVLQSGGAVFPPKTKAKLVGEGVNLKTTWGQTEIAGPMRTIPHTRDNANYYHMRNLWSDTPYIKMEPVGDGTFECVVYKGFPLAAELWLNPDAPNPYRTNDVFYEDPPGSGFWVLLGRKDDVIVHTNGEKTQAVSVQTALEDSDTMIYKAAVFGTNQPCTACILELIAHEPNPKSSEEIEEHVWEAVERANEVIPKHSRLSRSMVIILSPREHLPLTPKGNVRRKSTWDLFGDRVEILWEQNLTDAHGVQSPPESTMSDEEYIRDAVAEMCALKSDQVVSTTNLYDYGLESQKAVRLRSRLVKRFGQFPMTFIFENPTLESLVAYLSKTASPTGNHGDMHKSEWMRETIGAYERSIDHWQMERTPPQHKGKIIDEVLYITGASGALGNALLEEFVASPRVSRIYCAVRGESPLSKVVESLKERGYPAAVYSSEKLVGVTYNMKSDTLGLDAQTYSDLANEVTIVIHNAWRLDFNQPVQLFEPDCIKGTLNILSFCYTRNRKIFSFVSSISTVTGPASRGRGTIPESAAERDPGSAANMGYAQSKYVTERVAQYYATALGMPTCVLRVGQLCGHSRLGAWNATEAWPLLMATGLEHLGALPRLDGKRVDWLAVDACARSVEHILMSGNGHRHEHGLGNVEEREPTPTYAVYNLTNPRPVSWEALLDMLAEVSDEGFERISMGEWTARLEKLAEQGRSDVPGLKLLGFFQEMARRESQGEGLGSAHIIADSVIGAEPISVETVRKWWASWKTIGFVRG